MTDTRFSPAAGPPDPCRLHARQDGPSHNGAQVATVWLVGLRHRDGSGALVHHYYVVAGTPEGSDALRRARRCADQPPERLLRDDATVDASWAEVRRLIPDALGRYRLAGRVG
ncbi:hypothetical protein PV703_29880 [Streptomyces sp. ME01-24h]|nr:hypothetical protein [Streptomyces sp. ME19-03-3]MDX3357437.1 hypothetical protein [Streptomyces sp. ME01-24h]